MSIPVQKFNEIALQLLFALDMGGGLEEDLISLLMRELSVTRKTVRAAYEKAHAVFQVREMLDQKIGSISQEYALERIQRVERNVLRLAFYDLLQDTEESHKIIIAAALNLTRKFSTKEATKFVNAILDSELSDARPALSSSEEQRS